MLMTQTRRRFLTSLSVAGAVGLIRVPPAQAAEGTLETTTVRLAKIDSICIAPQHIAEELLRAEGFTDVRYVDTPTDAIAPAIGRGDVHFSMAAAFDHIQAIDAGVPIVVLAGIHVGCFELFGNEGVRSITELKGKSVGIEGLRSPHAAFVAIMAAHVGLDPAKDIRWVIATDLSVKPLDLACLLSLPLLERERLLGGNWKIRPAAGLYFKREWCAVVDEVPADLDVIRYWDLAATEKTEFNDPDWTVGVKLGRDQNGGYGRLGVVPGRANPGDVDTLLLNTATQDGTRVRIGFGQDPGQARHSQALHLWRALSAFTVT